MKRYLTTLALTLTVLVSSSRANTGISWGNNFGDTLPLLDNHGNIFDTNVSFELGTFGSFVPTLANISLWQSNWKLLSAGEWDSPSQTFGQSLTFDNTNGKVQGLVGSATFAANEQAYIWVRNGAEWALVTDNDAGGSSSIDDIWKLPDPFAVPGSAAAWAIDTANTVIMGGVNGIQSGTPYAYDPGLNFRLQTAVVPEPGTSLLVLVAGCMLRFIRGRRVRAA